jgi:hypothetical protein
MMKISISICPTSLEFTSGDLYDEHNLLAGIRSFVEERHPTATITCLQIGHRQGDEWSRIDGDEEAGIELLAAFFEEHGTDEDLFVQQPKPVIVEFAVADETIRDRGGIDEFAGLEHPYMADACAAYRAAATATLADDARASRLVADCPQGQRILHSAWAGTYWKYSSGAIGTMAALTDAEKSAVSAADDAGREAARKVIEEADAVA